jgi:translation initiation factor 2 subunit 3
LEVDESTCGGLIALETSLDPNLTKSDKLVGCVAGTKNLPEVIYKLETEYKLFSGYELKTGDTLFVTCRNSRSTGNIVSINKERLKVELKLPICADKGNKVSYSKLIEGKWRLVGWSKIS